MLHQSDSSKGVFVTGTDTDSGKTWVSLGLIEWLKGRGKTTLAMKPVASGSDRADGELVNSDALLLQQHASFEVDYQLVNPYAFEPPIAPHIAADKVGIDICMNTILGNFQMLRQRSEVVVVEGVGGWEVPLSQSCAVADMARILDLPIILVVGMRLGCLNHAILTCEALERSGCRILGWVANHVDPEFSCVQENIRTLTAKLSIPLLGVVPPLKTLDAKMIARVFDNCGGCSHLNQYFESEC